MEYNSHTYIGGVAKSILKILDDHILIRSVSLFYRYYNGICFSEIKGPTLENHILLRSSPLPRRAHTFVVV